MTHRSAILVLLILALTAEPAWQNSDSRHESQAQDPNWRGLVESMERMHNAIRSVKPSADSDRDFVDFMLPHHQAAIDMAKLQLIYGKDPQMRRLAQEIVTDQQLEITLMQLWLKQHQPDKSSSLSGE